MIFDATEKIMPVWGIHRADPGFIYLIESHGRYKIGKTKRTKDRLRAAKTWLPDMRLIGFKPFWGVSHRERLLHCGFARYWYALEWFNFEGDDDVRDILVDGFAAFSDDSPDRNSVDFIYWFNGDGMSEFLIEMDQQKLTLPKFQMQESFNQRRVDRAEPRPAWADGRLKMIDDTIADLNAKGRTAQAAKWIRFRQQLAFAKNTWGGAPSKRAGL